MNAVLEHAHRDNELEFRSSEAGLELKRAPPQIIRTRSFGVEVVELVLPDRSIRVPPVADDLAAPTVPQSSSPPLVKGQPVSDTSQDGRPFLPPTKHPVLDAIAEIISAGAIQVEALASKYGLKTELLPQYSSNYGLFYRGETRGHPLFSNVEAIVPGPLARVQGATVKFKTKPNQIRLKHLTDSYGTARLFPIRAGETPGAPNYVGITYASYAKSWGSIAFAFGATPDETLIEVVVIFWAKPTAGFQPNGLPIDEPLAG
jgi:hypothetical protein